MRKKAQGKIHPTAVAALTAAVLFSICACSADGTSDAADKAETKTVGEGEQLVIPISEVSETAQFYPVNVNGTEMEIIAVKDSSGNIRTAFNTCQICYDSGRGYYKQVGELFVCQNCGNRFTAEQIEIQAGGCNPYPIFDTDKTVTDDSIVISYDFLEESRKIFLNWKMSY